MQLGMASALETLCGQAFGVGRHAMLRVYMQRSWIMLLACVVVLLPGYFLVEAALLAAGQPPELSAMAGRAVVLFVPMQLAFALLFLLRRFLQCQGKNWVASAAAASTASSPSSSSPCSGSGSPASPSRSTSRGGRSPRCSSLLDY
jgi:MATE family multidrug resistance protein